MKDRNLGNEWKRWNGELENTDTSKGIFLILFFFVVIIFSSLILLLNFFISPRLAQIHHLLPNIFNIIVIATVVSLFCFVTLITICSILNINLFNLDKRIYLALQFFPWVNKIAGRIGISRDRIGNSFIQLFNSLVQQKKIKLKPEEILVLLPRCLKKDVRKNVLAVVEKYKIKVFVLAGGEDARARISQLKPKAFIAVACERDLIAGMFDLAQIRLKGIAIPNQRPEGPCKNTTMNIIQLENSIRFFLGQPQLS